MLKKVRISVFIIATARRLNVLIFSENTPRKELSAKIFGQAKPVDTAAREMQIEERLQRERGLAINEGDSDKSASSKFYVHKLTVITDNYLVPVIHFDYSVYILGTEDNYESRRDGDHKESKWSKERDDRNHSSSQVSVSSHFLLF